MNRHRQQGLNLVEMMVAMTIGLVLLAGLVTLFSNSSEAQRELQRAAAQIENGRYAMDTLTQDLHHAGYYGQYLVIPGAAAAPDPCALATETTLFDGLKFPVQHYPAANNTSWPDISLTSCGLLLTNANLNPGSDVVVMRRAETSVLAVGSIATTNEVYLQANPIAAEIQYGNGAAITAASKASGGAATVLKKDNSAAEIRKYRVHVYFVAPCSVPAGGATLCTGATDDGGRPLPTLKRLELGVPAGGGALTYTITPLAEGVEYLKVEYGIDDTPSAVSEATGQIGDGAPDRYTRTPVLADLGNIVTARIHVVVRNPEPSAGVDDKTYSLGLAGTFTPAAGDQFKRHGYVGEARVVNVSSRREIP